jgi:hypothetical protein
MVCVHFVEKIENFVLRVLQSPCSLALMRICHERLDTSFHAEKVREIMRRKLSQKVKKVRHCRKTHVMVAKFAKNRAFVGFSAFVRKIL